jgi:splicing factor 3B subunit 1
VLPHLKNLVEIVEHGLKDEQQKVRTITALALSALAEASNPYGIEAFESVLIPLVDGILMYRGKSRAAFLKSIGFIIPLMDAENARVYTKLVAPVLIKEFENPDDEMKKIVLKVVKQYVSSDGVDIQYLRSEFIPEFFSNYWIRKNALDRKNYK